MYGVVPASISPPQTGPTRTPTFVHETECSVGPDEVLGPPRNRRNQCRGRRPDEEGSDALRDGNCDEDGDRREEYRRDGRNRQCDEAQREHRCEDAFTRVPVDDVAQRGRQKRGWEDCSNADRTDGAHTFKRERVPP